METYICRVLRWNEHNMQTLTEIPYEAPSWPAAMAMANNDGHGDSVASWVFESGLFMMMHDSKMTDTEWCEEE